MKLSGRWGIPPALFFPINGFQQKTSRSPTCIQTKPALQPASKKDAKVETM